MKEKKYSTFANNLKYFMSLNNKTRNDIARDLNYNYTTIREWCNGTAFPRYDKIEELVKYFNISKSDLLEEKNNGFYTSTLRNEMTLQKYINNLAKNQLQRDLLVNASLLNDDYSKIINEQVQYYLNKQLNEYEMSQDEIDATLEDEKNYENENEKGKE